MKAIIFGGIGTIANTSYLQRKAFNTAFEQLSVDWHWDESQYRRLLVEAGGKRRISKYNDIHGGLSHEVTAADIHKLKTRLFHDFMASTKVPLRPGVEWVIEQAKFQNIKILFATTTSRKNVDVLLQSVGLDRSTFGVISDASLIGAQKPDPEVYHYCVNAVKASANNSIAIEDAGSGIDAAVAAGIKCIAFPNEFTAKHNYVHAIENVENLALASHLRSFFA
jgi:HAD superfamily hydrolase (TIGR01509 family)